MWGRFQKSEAFMTVFNSFADLAQARINLADAREGITESYDGAFLEHSDLAKLNIIEAPIAAEMPDPDMARRAVSTRSPRRVTRSSVSYRESSPRLMATTVISASSTAEDDHATTDREHPAQWDISILRGGTFLLCAYTQADR